MYLHTKCESPQGCCKLDTCPSLNGGNSLALPVLSKIHRSLLRIPQDDLRDTCNKHILQPPAYGSQTMHHGILPIELPRPGTVRGFTYALIRLDYRTWIYAPWR